MTERVATVAVDFDGVIHAYRLGWHDGTIYDVPIAGALEGLRTLRKTFAVFVHTTRNPVHVAAWLARHGTCDAVCEADVSNEPGELTFWTRQDLVLVTDRKLPAIAYIDDRGIRFTSWPQALADLEAVTRG
ncbi:hypothetical protein GCM10027258_62930 [Amycolatopsis stemonae]